MAAAVDDPGKFKFGLATWTPDGGSPTPLCVESLDESTENRVVARARPYRQAAKLDSTRRSYRVWTLRCFFFEGCTEPGIPSSGYYPDKLNTLQKAFDDGDQSTGTLTIGRRGPVRAKWKTCTVAETCESPNSAAVTLVFWEDNEDEVTLSSFTASAASQLPSLGQSVLQGAAALGLWSDDLMSLSSALTSFTNILGSAANIAGDLLATAVMVSNLCNTIEAAFSVQYDENAGPGSMLALLPSAAVWVLELRQIRWLAEMAQIIVDPVTIYEHRFAAALSILDVCADLGADPDDTIALNRNLVGHLLSIPPGTIVRAYV